MEAEATIRKPKFLFFYCLSSSACGSHQRVQDGCSNTHSHVFTLVGGWGQQAAGHLPPSHVLQGALAATLTRQGNRESSLYSEPAGCLPQLLKRESINGCCQKSSCWPFVVSKSLACLNTLLVN